MKYSIQLLFTILLLFATTNVCYAQPGKEKKEKAQKQVDKGGMKMDKGEKQMEKGQQQVEKGQKEMEKAQKHREKAAEKGKEAKEDLEEVGEDGREYVRDRERESREDQQERKDPESQRKEPKARKDKENIGKGKAYGKDKGDLSGREFGQERARQAKLKKAEREQALERTVSENETRVLSARDRIRVANEELESEKEDGTVNDEEYEVRKEKIARAEKALIELEEKINKSSEVKTPTVIK